MEVVVEEIFGKVDERRLRLWGAVVGKGLAAGGRSSLSGPVEGPTMEPPLEWGVEMAVAAEAPFAVWNVSSPLGCPEQMARHSAQAGYALMLASASSVPIAIFGEDKDELRRAYRSEVSGAVPAYTRH